MPLTKRERSQLERQRYKAAGTYTCEFCDKVYGSKYHLRAHMVTHTKEKSYACTECDKSYVAENGLKFHIDAVHKKKKYPCPVPNCGAVLSYPSALKLHQQTKHDKTSALNSLTPCPICEIMVKKVTLGGHVRGHNYEKRKHKCEKCEKRFWTSAALNKHENTHLPTKNRPLFPCNICDFKAKNADYLQTHIQTKHTKIQVRTHACTFCDKKFKYPIQLLNHVRTHTREMPYVCSLCERGFVSRSKLNEHIRTSHLGLKLKCELCPKTFVNKTGLTNHHVATHSKEEGKHVCPTCDKKFTLKSYLDVHLKCHGEEKDFKCSLCDMRFLTNSNMRKHERTHSSDRPYSCSKCDKTYRTKGTLNDHMFSHLSEKFTCKICGLAYPSPRYLEDHMRRKHCEPDPRFKCQFCGLQCESGYKLNIHIKSHLKEKF